MKHSFLDKYSDGNSIIHRLDPRTKLIAALVFIALVVLIPYASWLTYGLYFMVVLPWLSFRVCLRLISSRVHW
jgi:energy-coupling factor transporter transmembrane protein EcfT